MRSFFEEGDLLVCEVQAFFTDGAMSLHTRSLKYGKVRVLFLFLKWARPKNVLSTQLRNGQLVNVPPVLVRRLKSHFIALPCGVDLILGLNGRVWVSKHVPLPDESADDSPESFNPDLVYSNQNDVSQTSRLFA